MRHKIDQKKAPIERHPLEILEEFILKATGRIIPKKYQSTPEEKAALYKRLEEERAIDEDPERAAKEHLESGKGWAALKGYGTLYGYSGFAIEEFTKAIERLPDYIEAYLARMRVYLQQGDTAAANLDLKKVYRIIVSDVERGDIEQGRDKFNRFMSSFPEEEKQRHKDMLIDALCGYAKHKDSIGNPNAAIGILGFANKLDENDTYIYYRIGKVFYNNKEFDGAIKYLSRSIELIDDKEYKNKANIHALRGSAYEAKGDYCSAIKDLERTHELNPETMQNKGFPEAIERIRRLATQQAQNLSLQQQASLSSGGNSEMVNLSGLLQNPVANSKVPDESTYAARERKRRKISEQQVTYI